MPSGVLLSLVASMLLSSSGELLTAGESALQWNRPDVGRQASQPAVSSRQQEMFTDQQVMAAAWEEDDAEMARDHADGERRSILVRQSVEPDYMPDDSAWELPEEPRVARLPEDIPDPFDEPDADYLPADLPSDTETDLDAVESAIESEQESREGAGEDASEELDPFGGSEEEFSEEVEMPAATETEPEIQAPEWGKYDATYPERTVEQPEEVPAEVEEDDEDIDEDIDAELREQLVKERLKSEEVCREEAAEIRAEGLDAINLNIRVNGNAGEDFPFACSVDPSAQGYMPRCWPQVTYNWKASGLCHKPLYFEQVQLERYGHSWGPYVQPIMSGAHFFATLPVLPYKMGLKTPGECVYTLGHYRPGSCAPQMLGGVPFSWRAALFEGGAATGISFIVP